MTLGFIELYKNNKIVKFCTNWTAILGFIAVTWQGGAWAVDLIDGRYAKEADIQLLKVGQEDFRREQKEQRFILERQGKQLDFIVYDAMKREKTNLEREVFELRSRTNRTPAQNARLEQLVDDLRDLNRRLREQEEVVRGQR